MVTRWLAGTFRFTTPHLNSKATYESSRAGFASPRRFTVACSRRYYVHQHSQLHACALHRRPIIHAGWRGLWQDRRLLLVLTKGNPYGEASPERHRLVALADQHAPARSGRSTESGDHRLVEEAQLDPRMHSGRP